MTNNYLTSAYPAQAMLKLWINDDKNSKPVANSKPVTKARQLVFVSSAAAFAAIPGYTVYTRQSPQREQREEYRNIKPLD
jgi:3-dehydrosphinganine reductase